MEGRRENSGGDWLASDLSSLDPPSSSLAPAPTTNALLVVPGVAHTASTPLLPPSLIVPSRLERPYVRQLSVVPRAQQPPFYCTNTHRKIPTAACCAFRCTPSLTSYHRSLSLSLSHSSLFMACC